MTPHATTRAIVDRRTFLAMAASAAVVGPLARPASAASRTSMCLAYTSFAIRMRQAREGAAAAARSVDADVFRELCAGFGTGGGQVDFSQLPSGADGLAAVREGFERDGLELEVSMPARALQTPDAFAGAVATARALGATRARVAILSGRRYENFDTAEAWVSFASTWRETLLRMRPAFEQERFHIGIENHKDWTAPDLVALLKAIDSPFVGACVDFGNNLALLEDPDETIESLAPFAVTTHIKDMAVRRSSDGFELSEVPLGQGILPLGRYVAAIRRARPEARFCLEMITRDPLQVPYRTDRYWVPFDAAARRPARLRAFEARVLAHEWTRPLPRVSGLTAAAQLAAEDDNVRACVAHARDVLKLEAR